MDWKRGYSLKESNKIYSDYSIINCGETKKLICKLNRKHPDYEKNIRLIESIPEIVDFFKEIVKDYEKYKSFNYYGMKENIYEFCDQILKKTI